ncbi:MAG: eukaryotic-like serine/threonine-protein kinase [Micromonosporaceae bacterium]|nr:eukaryotic-like serine/threonine-protein kinase [Micromonosporaceae bacterium]
MESVQVLGGRYRLVERLGSGGMSVVWRAYDEVLGRQVAVKVLAAKLTADRESKDMIRAEAQAAARLSHPHVTGVYDYGESTTEDGHTVPYVVMELISGRTLAARLARGPLPWRAALRVGAEVAAALAAAHARGLVHRDVKPANVMLTAAGAKVVDFGIAAVAGESGAPGPEGVVLGTPAYLAPERLAGGVVRPATDVYALGLLLYRSLTGSLPWQAETTTQMIAAHVYVEPAPMPSVDGLPDGVAELCLRCLAKDPQERPTSREVARTLAAAAGIRVQLPADSDESEDLVLDPVRLSSHAGVGRPPGRLRQAVAALFGPGVDASAETAILPSSVIDSAGIRHVRRQRRRRALQVAGITGGVAAAGLILANCSDLPVGDAGHGAAAATAPHARPTMCSVRYQTRRDSGSEFAVDVTVTNTSGQAMTGWLFQFVFTGDQTVRQGTGGQWGQSPGGQVTVREPDTTVALPAHASTSTTFVAAYHKSNPMPTMFALSGAPCSYVLIGASGTVQSGRPRPGLTVSPDGRLIDRGSPAGGSGDDRAGGPAGGAPSGTADTGTGTGTGTGGIAGDGSDPGEPGQLDAAVDPVPPASPSASTSSAAPPPPADDPNGRPKPKKSKSKAPK